MGRRVTELAARFRAVWRGVKKTSTTKDTKVHEGKTQGRFVLFLVLQAVVAATTGDHDALDSCLADQTGLGLSAIDVMLQLEESFFAAG
jgi:hypothetical protein